MYTIFQKGDRMVSGIGNLQLMQGRAANIGTVIETDYNNYTIGWARSSAPDSITPNDYHAISVESDWYITKRYRLVGSW